MPELKVKKYLQSPSFSLSHKFIRVLWGITYVLFFKPSPVPFFAYRRWLLTLFGARLERKTNIYPTVKIWFPRNLTMAAGATIGPYVTIYNQGEIVVGANVIVSQGAHICASTHDYNDPLHPLLLAPIRIENNVWICADAFVGPGVTVTEGAVLGARGVLMKNTEAWGVYGGNPAKKLNDRKKFNT
jgi:putative colanic acid biosynthesis acetyltransferase WcaF